ncbi:MAG: hypothetical protein U9Q03_06450 [Patescibacteria group bacterium]|nr:hypothetical protein [Patescibacteria group bacterium]
MSKKDTSQADDARTSPIAPDDDISEDAKSILGAIDAKFSERLMDLIATDHRHPDMFLVQARLLKKRFDTLKEAGFTKHEALQIILRFGLKKDLADE